MTNIKTRSKYKGVSFKPSKYDSTKPESSRPWIVRIVLEKRQVSIGTFETEELAALAFDYGCMVLGKEEYNKLLFPELEGLVLPDHIKQFLNLRIVELQERIEGNPIKLSLRGRNKK